MVDRKPSKGGGTGPPVPPGWELSDGRMLARKIRFPDTQAMTLWVLRLLVLATRSRVGVTLAFSGRYLSVMLMEPPEPCAGASRKLFNLAARLG